jgi:hypothetical protein
LTHVLPSTFARQFLATLENSFLWRSVQVFGESLNAKVAAKLSLVDARHLVSPGDETSSMIVAGNPDTYWRSRLIARQSRIAWQRQSHLMWQLTPDVSVAAKKGAIWRVERGLRRGYAMDVVSRAQKPKPNQVTSDNLRSWGCRHRPRKFYKTLNFNELVESSMG